jgi:HEAT repeat protein
MLVSVSYACHPAGMGKKRGILLAVLFVALLGGLVWMLSRPAEPVCKGKPLSAWLNEFNGVPGETNQAAFVAFREMGTNAIPALLKTLQSGDPRFQRMILKLNRMQSLVHFPLRDTLAQRWAASSALYAMGANAKPAFPALTNLLFDPTSSYPSAIALAGMGSEALPPLFAALTNQNATIRDSAAFGLSWERSDLNLVVPALIGRLSDQDMGVHYTALEALCQLHAEPELAVPALMEEFPGKNPGFRRVILIALGEFGTSASAAVPMLLEVLSDNDQEERKHAAWALKRIDPEAAAKAGVK